MFGDSIAFVCFYNADRVLYVVAKFLVHLHEEGEGSGRVWRGGKWEGTKIAPKPNIFGIWGLWPHVIHFYKALFTS